VNLLFNWVDSWPEEQVVFRSVLIGLLLGGGAAGLGFAAGYFHWV
jgi:hypothetical protein